MSTKLLPSGACGDGDEAGNAIVFANSTAHALRLGAAEIDSDYPVDCFRVKPLDEFAEKGVVPPLVFIELGWFFECQQCSRRVHKKIAEDLADDGMSPENFGPIVCEETGVFCSKTCHSEYNRLQIPYF